MNKINDKNHVILIRPYPVEFEFRGGQLSLPEGVLYLAHSLLESGYKVSIIDSPNEIALKEINRIVSKNTLCFGISTMSGTQLANAIKIATLLKSKYPAIPVIWGGVHVTARPAETLQSELVDYIVWGEGENAIVPLVSAIKNNEIKSLNGMRGIGFKDRNSVFLGENSGYVSLDRVFRLPYHLLDMEKYPRKLLVGANREFPIYTSRGCPNRCKYCSNSSATWPNTKIRYHTIDHVINDIRTLVEKYGADMVTLADESFLINQQNVIDMMKAIRKEGISVKYRFTAHINFLLNLKEETWQFFKDHNVVAIGTAPESGSQKVLNSLGKYITLEKIHQVNNLITKYGFYKMFNIMICTPYETREDLRLSLKLVAELARTSTTSPYPFGKLNKYIPLPGTELYEEAIKLGFNPPDNLNEWSKFDFGNFENTKDIVRPWIRKEDFDYIQRAIYLVERLDCQFTGVNADKEAIRGSLQKIDQLIAEG